MTAAIGSAAGYLTWLELAGTLVFGGLLAALCLLKPLVGYEGSNLMTLLKGAEMSAIDGKICEIEEKLGMTKDQEQQEVSITA